MLRGSNDLNKTEVGVPTQVFISFFGGAFLVLDLVIWTLRPQPLAMNSYVASGYINSLKDVSHYRRETSDNFNNWYF